jgi:hypothetical protein
VSIWLRIVIAAAIGFFLGIGAAIIAHLAGANATTYGAVAGGVASGVASLLLERRRRKAKAAQQSSEGSQ